MPSRRAFLSTLAAAPLAASLMPLAARAATPPIYSEGSTAVDGTDVVAYFTEGKPVAGSASFTHDWMGTTWQFSSEENRAAFAADPEAYAPQYGGYCAFAVSQGYTASTVPDAWTIHDGKLYLNFSRSVKRRWERDIPGNVALGDANWPGVLNA